MFSERIVCPYKIPGSDTSEYPLAKHHAAMCKKGADFQKNIKQGLCVYSSLPNHLIASFPDRTGTTELHIEQVEKASPGRDAWQSYKARLERNLDRGEYLNAKRGLHAEGKTIKSSFITLSENELYKMKIDVSLKLEDCYDAGLALNALEGRYGTDFRNFMWHIREYPWLARATGSF